MFAHWRFSRLTCQVMVEFTLNLFPSGRRETDLALFFLYPTTNLWGKKIQELTILKTANILPVSLKLDSGLKLLRELMLHQPTSLKEAL